MARSIHVRLDDSSAAALAIIGGGEMTDSEAVRTAIRETAGRRQMRSAIRQEAQRLSADEGDLTEMRAIREQLDELAPEDSDE